MTRGTVTPKDIDEVNKREVCECDGLEMGSFTPLFFLLDFES